MPEKTSKTETTKQESSPWAPQIPYLTDAFSKAQSNYNTGAGDIYGGDTVAQFNPEQLATFRSMLGYANGNNAPQTTGQVGQNLAQHGAGSLTNAVDFLGQFKPEGGTESNIAAAGQYADNPYISGQVDAAMRDANRQASEGTLPQIARSAAATGNLNSNRTAISQGLVQRGLNDQAGDISAAMRGSAYDKGLSLAEGGRQFDNSATLEAQRAAGSLAGDATTTGVGAMGAGIDQANSLFGIAGTGGEGLRTAEQAKIDNERGTSEYSTDRINQLLQQYFGVVGGTGYGGTMTGTNQTDTAKYASPWTIAGGIAGTAGSFMMPGAGGVSAAGNIGKMFAGSGMR